MPGPTSSPVAAEGLRERVQRAILHARCDCLGRDGWACSSHRAVAVLAELVGDPGDLPARMAAEMRRHHPVDINHPGWSVAEDTCECGVQVTYWDAHRAAAALGVRDEHLAHMTARALYAEGQLSARRDHETRWETEKARADKAEAERKATHTAIYDTRITHIRQAHPTRMYDQACRACRVLVDLGRRLPSHPDDPKEIRRLAQATTEETNDG